MLNETINTKQCECCNKYKPCNHFMPRSDLCWGCYNANRENAKLEKFEKWAEEQFLIDQENYFNTYYTCDCCKEEEHKDHFSILTEDTFLCNECEDDSRILEEKSRREIEEKAEQERINSEIARIANEEEAKRVKAREEKERLKAEIAANPKNKSRRDERANDEQARLDYNKECQQWRDENREAITIYNREYHAKRRREDLGFKIAATLRGRLYSAIKNKGLKLDSAITLVGCPIPFLLDYLRERFLPGMSWNNYGKGPGKWHIDHIVPCDYFDMVLLGEQVKCFHYTNLQPLWEPDNQSKNATLPQDFIDGTRYWDEELKRWNVNGRE